MLRSGLLSVAVLLATMPLAAGPIASLLDGRVIVEMPPGWQRVDPGELEELAWRVAEAAGGKAGVRWAAGLAPGGRVRDLSLPFVLVETDESGRTSHAELAVLPDIERLRDRAGTARSDGSRLRLEGMRFDRRRFALETIASLSTSHWVALEIRSVTYLTATGSVTLHGYLPGDAGPSDRRAVGAVLDQVWIADELTYHPHLKDYWQELSRRPWFWYALAGVAAIVTALVARSARRGTPS